jgi:hypothetical protein
MLWKKGQNANIDQRHWFRDVAFQGLNWQQDPQHHHLERAAGVFELVVGGVNAGVFNLRLTHNTDTLSASYAQYNSMTQIHWGPALPHVANPALLNRTMHLYLIPTNPPRFRIEIP